MSRIDTLTSGMTLGEGQFMLSLEGTYFAGIHQGQFGVFAGTPAAPLGTSITLSNPCVKVSMLADGRLATYKTEADTEPNWTTPAPNEQSYAVLQSDGNLCVYTGADTGSQGRLLFGSVQSGARNHDFLPYPQFQSAQSRKDTITSGMTLGEGQFIYSLEGNYFAGIHLGQFGVFAGTPAAPQGTSITLSYPCTRVTMLADGRLATYLNATDTAPAWTTPLTNQQSYAVLQSDGNLCVYTGPDTSSQGRLVFGSMQSGARNHNFLPYPQFQATQVTVTSFLQGQFYWCVLRADGSESPRVHMDPGMNPGGFDPSTGTTTVAGQAGEQCCLRGYDVFGNHHDSGDDFGIGEVDVRYSATTPMSPLDWLSWDRK